MKQKSLFNIYRQALAGCCALLLLASAFQSVRATQGGQREQSAMLPDSPVGQLARLFVDAVNSSDRSTLQNFIAQHLSERALEETSAGDYLSFLQKLSEQSAGIDVKSATSEGPGLALMIKSRRGEHWARIVIFPARSQPDRLSALFILPTIDPAIERAHPWPNAKMSESEVARLIEGQATLVASLDRFSGVLLVAKGERVIVNRAYGQADKSFNVPNNLQTKFNLGSMDKMFTSVAIAQLVQAGKLSYDDTLAKLLPEYPNREDAAKITVHQLLTHTAGTGDFFLHPEFRPHRERYKNPADYFPLFKGERLAFEPGSRWQYSNSGYVILGRVIEKLSGENYFDYVRKHIFEPAGMTDTGSYELNEVVQNLAVGYMRTDASDPLGIEARRSNVMFIPWKGNPAGGGYSTAPDLLRFAQALRARKLVNARLTELLTSGKYDFPGPYKQKYAYGFAAEQMNGKEVRGMSGGGANSGVNSDLEMFWDGSYTVIVLGNYDAPAASELSHKICEFLAHQ